VRRSTNAYGLKLEVLKVVSIETIIFWDKAPYSLVDIYQLLPPYSGQKIL
jgi:hypothetical protein